mmetsp:Transcript_128978/g.359121  ORF Transcript_128978/g.359121 Transcript_128978/m.359121 type:complete len:80 (+) Transcript_128978:1018-1257(+)
MCRRALSMWICTLIGAAEFRFAPRSVCRQCVASRHAVRALQHALLQCSCAVVEHVAADMDIKLSYSMLCARLGRCVAIP